MRRNQKPCRQLISCCVRDMASITGQARTRNKHGRRDATRDASLFFRFPLLTTHDIRSSPGDRPNLPTSSTITSDDETTTVDGLALWGCSGLAGETPKNRRAHGGDRGRFPRRALRRRSTREAGALLIATRAQPRRSGSGLPRHQRRLGPGDASSSISGTSSRCVRSLYPSGGAWAPGWACSKAASRTLSSCISMLHMVGMHTRECQ